MPTAVSERPPRNGPIKRHFISLKGVEGTGCGPPACDREDDARQANKNVMVEQESARRSCRRSTLVPWRSDLSDRIMHAVGGMRPEAMWRGALGAQACRAGM